MVLLSKPRPPIHSHCQESRGVLARYQHLAEL